MILDRLIRDYIRAWQTWRSDRRLERAIPGYLERKREIEILRRKHRSTKQVLAEQKAAMNDALRGRANG